MKTRRFVMLAAAVAGLPFAACAEEAANEKPMKDFGVSGIPHIEFLGTDGKSVGKQVGGLSPEDFAKKLDGVLKKGAEKK